MSEIKPWRDVVRPHPDVREGRYAEAEFAADLAQVLRGDAESEYQDPEEFFQRTFITNGMDRLISEALKRVSNRNGEPIVKLKTTFGGGKTHTMLALYHLFSGEPPEDLRGIPEILENVGLDEIPEANVGVLVGTALDPTQAKEHSRLDGGLVRTLWGELAAQLGGNEAYEQVRQADESGSAPGADTLVDLFDEYGPAVILIDELVAYARNLYGQDQRISGGSFDSVMTFVQNLTEAVKRSKEGMIVASIPESDIEIGEEGQGGHRALETIEHTFGRLESTWTPVESDEGFRIVRRRLFTEIDDEDAREEVCRAYHQIYRENEGDFPHECKEKPYLDELIERYPIHPEVFDRLYDDWATLENFQRTRGVLRLLAAVIHELWKSGDDSPMIMPGSFPLDDADVRNRLLRYLPENWYPVVEKDVDGEKSEALKVDNSSHRIGQYMAGRRVARAVFLGSAPSVKEQRVRGIEGVRIRLGVAEPEEPIAVYNDALSRLGERCHHLYEKNNRYWFDTRPNLRRTVEDKASQVPVPDAQMELESRLRGIKGREEFEAVHTCPGSSGDVPDEDSARLVILEPKALYRDRDENPAEDTAKEILENRGSSPRKHRNMLLFLAPDEDKIEQCMTEIKRYLAWKEVNDEKEALNLDAHQMREAEEQLESVDGTVNLHINEAYCWLLVPYQSDPTGDVEWETKRLQGGHENIIKRASKAVVTAEQLIPRWSPALLKRELDQDKWDPWTDYHINTAKLWEYLTSYLYLPRLQNREVLERAIKQGIESGEYFGYATSVNDEGRYQGLKFGHSGVVVHFDDEAVLVKPDAAQQQLQEEREKDPDVESPTIVHEPTGGDDEQTKLGDPPLTGDPGSGGKHRFHARRKLPDPETAQSDFGQVVDEVIRHFVAEGAEVEIEIELQVVDEDGFSEDTMHTVSENCDTLRFEHASFEDE